MACSPSSSKNHKHKSRLCCWGGKPKHKRHGKVPSVDQGKIKPLIPTSSHVIGYGMVEEEDEMNRLDLGLEAYEKPHLENIQKADPNLKYNDMSKELNDAIVKVTPQLQPLSVMSDDLELLEQIGVGSSGCVFRAKFMGVTVAVKQCLICDLFRGSTKRIHEGDTNYELHSSPQCGAIYWSNHQASILLHCCRVLSERKC